MFLNFAEIPGLNNLFLDYVNEFENVAKFYAHDFRDESFYNELLKQLSGKQNQIVKTLSKAIRRDYSGKQLSKLTEKNIELLKEKNSIVILTEVGLSLFGGNLKNIIKIITTVKLANMLKDKFNSYNFIPVVYLLTEENDFINARKIKIFDEDFNIVEIEYDDGLEPEDNRGRNGEIIFKDTIEKAGEELKNVIEKFNFTEYALTSISAFREGATFAEATKKFFFNLFDKYGVVLFDPNNPDAKKSLSKIFKQEFENHELHSEDAVFRSADVEEFYDTVVKVRPVNLKFAYKKGLYAIEPDENIYKLKRKRQSFTGEELLQLLTDEPARFTPTTMLRAICESHLFPVAFVVGNPEEISSFAQTLSLFKFFDVIKPLVFPSASVTLSEFPFEELLSEFGLQTHDFFNDGENLRDKILNNADNSYLENIFNEAEKNIVKNFSFLKEKLTEFEPKLKSKIESAQKVSLENLNRLKQNAFETQKSGFKETMQRIEKIRASLFPNENLQEEEIAAIYFIAKYGEDTIPWLFNQLSINDFRHLITEI